MPQKDRTRTEEERGILLYPQYMKIQHQHPRRRLFHSPDSPNRNRNTNNRPLLTASATTLLAENKYHDADIDRDSFRGHHWEAEITDYIPDCNWEVLFSSEWLSEMEKVSLELCHADNSDPRSWVNMAVTDPPEEFWTQKLDFENEIDCKSIDFLERILEGNAELVAPEVLLGTLEDCKGLPYENKKHFINRFRELYLAKGQFEWANILNEYEATVDTSSQE